MKGKAAGGVERRQKIQIAVVPTVSCPLEMGSAHYLVCVGEASKYESSHKTDFQLFDYPERLRCR